MLGFCPKGGSGKGKGVSTGKTSSASGFVATEPEFVPGMKPLYLASMLSDLPERPPSTSTLVFSDGTREVLNLADALPPPGLSQRAFNFFASILVFMNSALEPLHCLFPHTFHALVRLASGAEGLLIDCGAITNLVGDRWVYRSEKLAQKNGQGTTWKEIPKCKVEGVGEGASEISKKATVPICLSSGVLATYEASEQ